MTGLARRVAIRADASSRIGHGHIMRCLTLAATLRRAGADVRFVCRMHPGHLANRIVAAGFAVHRLPSDQLERAVNTLGAPELDDAAQTAAAVADRVDWLIVDHYDVTVSWERRLRPLADRLLVIDDTAERDHHCDLLLDQNWYPNAEARYRARVADGATLLLGPAYALLRDDFVEARRQGQSRDGSVRRILVGFGGSAVGEVVQLALDAALGVAPDALVDVVGVESADLRPSLGATGRVVFHGYVSAMAELMAKADLAIGAGGAMTWERCCVGLPSLTIALARNQELIGDAAARAGACWYLGPAASLTANAVANAVRYALEHPAAVRDMSLRAAALCDGAGAARVAAAMGLPLTA